ASTSATVGGSTVNANVGTGNGPLVDSNTSGNPDGLNSNNAINLGNLFGGGGNGGGGDGGGGTGGGGSGGGVADGGGNGNGGKNNGNGGRGVVASDVQTAISGMSDGEVATMKRRCNGILAMPNGYDQGIIDLCRVLRSL
ncbi:MAG: hypothetical protein J0H08_02690, partial [Rhizobiales bacterium]|nr:hypothetical protein [Hyphomicrobiales bacterium]